jgi:hypothetical protein
MKSKTSKVVRFPRKSLKIRSQAKKAGVTSAVVERLIKSAQKTPKTAAPVVKVARLLARGKFRRADRIASKTHGPVLKAVRGIIVRGLRAVNPRYYQKHYAAA